MKEPESNIQYICKDCSDQKRVSTQKSLTDVPLERFVGRYVKKGFTEGSKTEHMWVKVTGFNDQSGTLLGELANDPFEVTHIKAGDEVVVQRMEIEDVLLRTAEA